VGSGSDWAYVDRRELRDWLRTSLPDYMVPEQYHFIPALPLTASGKIDERALVTLAASADGRGPSVPPANPTQEALARLWKSVLRVKEVGATDDFYELGGHSILAVQMLSRLARQFHVSISLRDLFADPTIRGLEAVLLRKQVGGQGG
jgi:hypothetical protein